MIVLCLFQLGDGSHIACKDLSMADLAVFPILAFQVRMGLKFDKFPKLQQYYQTMCDRASVKASWPPQWKEEEGKDLIGEL